MVIELSDIITRVGEEVHINRHPQIVVEVIMHVWSRLVGNP
jgi:hypothetical protein